MHNALPCLCERMDLSVTSVLQCALAERIKYSAVQYKMFSSQISSDCHILLSKLMERL